MTKLFSVAAAALAILAATSAHAEPRQLVMVSKTLTYRVQDVATAPGAEKLLNRIESTARSLCGPASQVAPHPDAASRRCSAQAVAVAVDALGAPLVTAAYAARRPDVAVASR